MRETPQLQGRRTRRGRQTRCQALELLRAPTNQYAYPRTPQEPRETVYFHSPTLLDYCLSAVSLNPEHPPGLLTVELEKDTLSIASLASLDPDFSSEKRGRGTPTSESTPDGRYIPALNDHLVLWIPLSAVVGLPVSKAPP
jgi:hypothetical protein